MRHTVSGTEVGVTERPLSWMEQSLHYERSEIASRIAVSVFTRMLFMRLRSMNEE